MADVPLSQPLITPSDSTKVRRANFTKVPAKSVVMIEYQKEHDKSATLVYGVVSRSDSNAFSMEGGITVYHGWIRGLWVMRLGETKVDKLAEYLYGLVDGELQRDLTWAATEHLAVRARFREAAKKVLKELDEGTRKAPERERYTPSEEDLAIDIFMATFNYANRSIWHQATTVQQNRMRELAREVLLKARRGG